MLEAEITAQKVQAIEQIVFHDLDENTLSPLPYERLQDVYEGMYTRNEDGGVDDGIGYGALAAISYEPSPNEINQDLNPVDIGKIGITARFIGTTLKLEEEQAKNSIDPLTGLLKREAFMTTLRDRIGENKKFAILMIDIDNFKQLNDVLGHRGGDVELQSVAEHIVRSLKMARSEDAEAGVYPRKNARDDATRTSGDEYIAVIDDIDGIDLETAREMIVNNLVSRYDDHVDAQYDGNLSLGLSVGWATYDPEIHAKPEDIVHAADMHMFKQKESNHQRLGYTHRPMLAPKSIPNERIAGRRLSALLKLLDLQAYFRRNKAPQN